jgi:hypothetical protein
MDSHYIQSYEERKNLPKHFSLDIKNSVDFFSSIKFLSFVFLITVLPATIAFCQTSQTKTFALHEIAPFVGFYAPDRYETSTAWGFRYYYQLDKRNAVGGIIGFARAKQDFLQRANGLSLQPGSNRVLYHGARATHAFSIGKIEPYGMFHLGLTRMYDENNFTYGFGLGTKIKLNPKFSFRYEFLNYIFSSGRDLSAWTNKNIEVSVVVGFYL